MEWEDAVRVGVPAALGVVMVVTLGLVLRLTKILKSLYLSNDFHLEPLGIYKSAPAPTIHLCAKSLFPLWGALHYSSPQFDLPPAAHIYLIALHLTLLWGLNLLLSQFTDSFRPELALTVSIISTGVSLTLTYALHSVYVSACNLSTDLQDANVSQSAMELQRSDIISTAVQPHKRGASWATVIPKQPKAASVRSLRLEVVTTTYTAIAITILFWSLAVLTSTSLPLDILLYHWLLGLSSDLPVRLSLCCILPVLKAVPNFSGKYVIIDYGLTTSQVYQYGKMPVCEQLDMSECEHVRRDTFSMEQLAIEPPPTTPMQGEDELGVFPGAEETVQWGEDYKRPSPEKNSPVRRERERDESEESQGSADTLPEMPHNLQSPVESPSISSHFHFFRTPERPYFDSPERSPTKPEIYFSPTKKDFELVLRPIQSEKDWHPVDPDQEVFVVEYLPGGIMTKGELQGSQYHLEAQESQVRGSYRSQSLPKPVSEVVQRAKSVIRQPSTPRLPEVMEGWMPCSRPVYSSQGMHEQDTGRWKESSPGQEERRRRVQAAKQSFKKTREQVNRSVSPYTRLLNDHTKSGITSAGALQTLAQIYTPHLPETPPPIVRRGRYLKKTLMED